MYSGFIKISVCINYICLIPVTIKECGEGSECQIFEPTGEAFCNPNCEELNPCGPH